MYNDGTSDQYKSSFFYDPYINAMPPQQALTLEQQFMYEAQGIGGSARCMKTCAPELRDSRAGLGYDSVTPPHRQMPLAREKLELPSIITRATDPTMGDGAIGYTINIYNLVLVFIAIVFIAFIIDMKYKIYSLRKKMKKMQKMK